MEGRQPAAFEDGGALYFPASPASEYMNSTAFSLSILAVFETEIPIDESEMIALLRDRFLPLNPRFSSLLLRDSRNRRQFWRRVEVSLCDHVKVPLFPDGLEPEVYDGHLADYLSGIFSGRLPEERPLWEMHLFKYPTSEGAGTVVLKVHHALGDGYSLMGALFSCLRRADDPSLPLTFPTASSRPASANGCRGVMRRMWGTACSAAAGFWNVGCDFAGSVLSSTVVADGRNAIRSGRPEMDKMPVSIATVSFPIDAMREIKHTVRGTINDVAMGAIFYGIHLYEQRTWCGNASKRKMTILVALNTRMVRRYQNVKEMARNKTWGNKFMFLHVSVPKLDEEEIKVNPLAFVLIAKKTIKRKKSSLIVILNDLLLRTLKCIKGYEEASRYIRSSFENASAMISHVVGPIERIKMANLPIKSFYFTVPGAPQSLILTLVSYHGNLRLAVAGEKDFIDSQLFTSCVKEAFNKIYFNACGKNMVE